MKLREMVDMLRLLEQFYGDIEVMFQDLEGDLHKIAGLGYDKDIKDILNSKPAMILVMEGI